MSQRTSSAAVPDGTADKPKTTSGLRSDATRPRNSRASITSTGAGSLLTFSAAAAAGTGSTAAAAGVRQPGSSSIPSRTGRLSSSSIQQLAANGTSSAATAASRLPSASAALAAAQEARHQQAAITPVPASSTAPAAAAAGTPSTPLLQPGSSTSSAYLQSNALFGQEHSSMTPSVRHKEYTPSLSPDMEQLAARAAAGASGVAAGGVTPAAGPGLLSTPIGGSALQQQQQQQLAAAAGVQKVWAPAAALPAVCKAPKAYLQTTGDLFAAPDQDTEEKLVVKMGSAQLVSPSWNQSRPWLTGSWLMQYPADFIAEVGGVINSTGVMQLPPPCDLSAAAPTQQEAALVEDLLGVFLGQAGQYVVHAMVEGPKWQRLGLQVKGVTEPSLVEQVERLLPLCECVYTIKRFVETRSRIDHPKVAQALAAAMRELQREWWLVVVQLDHLHRLGQLSLASLVYYCREPAASMQLLASIAGEAADQDALTSAGLLNLLTAKQRSLAGDRPGQVLLGRLLEAAAEPYFGILEKWLCRGELDDPYHEFMVKDDADVSRDSLTPDGQPAYWSQRYRLRGAVTAGPAGSRSSQHDVPEFLNSSKEAIVVTGKYLNVIRQCGQPVPPCPESTVAKLRYSAAAGDSGSPPFLQGIQEALSAAAGALLQLMCGPGPQGRLLSWLHCMKHFFMMDQGDLLVHLMEQPEMQEPPSCLAPHQLQGLLDAATRSSSVAASPHIDVVGEGVLAGQMDRRSLLQLVMAATCSMDGEDGGAASSSAGILPKGATDSTHSSLELLLLTVNLSWPISLVVSKRQLLHYQVVFKQLLSLKWAERDLGQAWQSMRATKRLSGEDQQRWRAWHMLCSQLTYVVGEVLRFTSIDVLEPLWSDMEARLLNAGNMDKVICLHNTFLSAALQRCLLTETHMVRHISELLQAAHALAKEVAGLNDSSTAGGPSSSSSARRPGQPQQRQQQQPQVNGLLVMSKFCRDEHRQAQLKALQDRVSDVLQRLVRDLNIHYQALLTAEPAAGGAAAAAGATISGTAGVGSLGGRLAGLALDGGWGGGAAGVAGAAAAAAGGGLGGSLLGDSSRDLASLHNLIQRLEVGCHMAGGTGAQQQAWPAAY